MNFVLKLVHEIREKFVHEFMPEDYACKEKIWGKVSVSLILPKIFQCRVLSAWADIEIQYVDIIKGNILIEIILQAVCWNLSLQEYKTLLTKAFHFFFRMISN